MSTFEYVGGTKNFSASHDVSFPVSPATWVEFVSIFTVVTIDATVSGTRLLQFQVKDAAGNIITAGEPTSYTQSTPSPAQNSFYVGGPAQWTPGGAFPQGLLIPPGGSIHLVDVNGNAPTTDSIALTAVFDTV